MRPARRFLYVTHAGWEERGLCASMDAREAAEIFFPFTESKNAVDRARDICGVCPVFNECLDLADSLPSGWPGIFAGLSRQDRYERRDIQNGRGSRNYHRNTLLIIQQKETH